MNQNKKRLANTMTTLGAVLLALRLRLYIVAVDSKNLLISGHWLSYVIWAVAAVCLAVVVVAALRTEERKSLSVGGPIAALGDGLFALAILIAVLDMDTPVSVLEKARLVVGYLCVPALLVSAVFRAKGKPVFFGCFCVVCVFFALYMVGFYQTWSSNPQLQDYGFAMLACAAVTLFAYQNAALSVGIGSRRVWLATGLATVAFGISAVSGSIFSMMLYLGAVGWALTGLVSGEKTEAL